MDSEIHGFSFLLYSIYSVTMSTTGVCAVVVVVILASKTKLGL